MRNYLFIAVGFMIAGLGAFPIMRLVAAEPDPVKDGTLAAVEVATTPPVATPVETTVAATEPETLGELSGSVSKVLELRGSATDTDLTDLGTTLPDAVARLLIDRNAVLVVPETVTP